jgi:hypothetical protein
VATDTTPTMLPPQGSEPSEPGDEFTSPPFDRSIRRQVALILAFAVLAVLSLTLAAGGVDAVGHTVTHLFVNPEACGGG